MNTPQDRANRIAGWSTRGRDLFWIMSMLVVVNLVILLLIGAGYETTFIPATVLLVFLTIMGILGGIDAMDDIAAVAADADEEERKTKSHARFEATMWVPFKVMLAAGFGLTALGQLYAMWFA